MTIRSRLIVVASLLVLIVFSVSLAAMFAVTKVDRNAEAVTRRWIAGGRALGELSDDVFRFRLAETERALAADSAAAEILERSALSLRVKADGAIKAYVTLAGGERSISELAAFRDAWRDYLLIHDAWIRADVYRHSLGLARDKSSLDWRYQRVSKSLDDLEAVNYEAVEAEIQASGRYATVSKAVVLVASIAALGLAVALAISIESSVVRPLSGITVALSNLASGGRSVPLPEVNRSDEIGEMAKAFEVFRSNAAELHEAHAETRAAQEQAHLLARHDALTGLPNRRVFASELEHALVRGRNAIAYSSVMLVDLDRFKPVNDAQGHSAGDRVLCEVARRIEAIPHRRKIVARLGSDEYAVIAETDPDLAAVEQDATAFANEILAAIREPIDLGERTVEIGASIGIAICPIDGDNPEDILRASDLAMDRAKHDGRDKVRFFARSMDEALREETALEDNLRSAVHSGEIRPYYQPLIGLGDERLHGFEVLARWEHPDRGAIPPDRFIAMAERLGLIGDLTTVILRQACRDARNWPKHLRLAVNVSPVQLVDRLFPIKVMAVLSAESFEPSRLELEITESALVGDIEVAKSILADLQMLGIHVSLDDFGTGYSSLYHLRNLKFDKLKIDRSFVEAMGADEESAKIVDAILGLATSLGMTVVAEGIETPAALASLLQRGCAFGQGYLFGKAMPRDLAAEFIGAYPLRKVV